jgi:hypothetical protein
VGRKVPSFGFVLLIVVNFNCLFNLQDHIVQSNKLYNSLCLFLMTTITKRIGTLMVPSFNKSSHSIACSYYFSKRNILGDSNSDKVKHPASQECSTAVEVLSIGRFHSKNGCRAQMCCDDWKRQETIQGNLYFKHHHIVTETFEVFG